MINWIPFSSSVELKKFPRLLVNEFLCQKHLQGKERISREKHSLHKFNYRVWAQGHDMFSLVGYMYNSSTNM